VEEIFWRLARKDEDPDFKDINTVVFDSGSELQILAIENLVGHKMQKESHYSSDKTKHETLDEVWVDDYGEVGKRVARWYRWYRDLDVNLIITSHAKKMFPRKDPRKSSPTPERDQIPLEVTPSMTPALRRHVEGYMDYIWYLYYSPSRESRVILTQPHGVYFAKTRGGRFAKSIGPAIYWPDEEIPMMAHIYEKLRNPEFEIPQPNFDEPAQPEEGEEEDGKRSAE
jgi:hypothetical protein